MKRFFTLSVLVSFAMICSCQKQNSAAEEQLAQRKTELDSREKALDEREKALAERENLRARAPGIPSDLHSRAQVRDPAELKAERERKLQQLPPGLKGLIADPSQGRDQNDPRMQERLAQRQRRTEELQRARMAHAVKPFGEGLRPQLHLLRQKLRRPLHRLRRSKLKPSLARLGQTGRRVYAESCKLASILQRVDGIDILVAPDPFYSRET